MFTTDETAICTWMVNKGIINFLSGLSEMVGQELNVTSFDLKRYPAKDAAMLLRGLENLVVGIYLNTSWENSKSIVNVLSRNRMYILKSSETEGQS